MKGQLLISETFFHILSTASSDRPSFFLFIIVACCSNFGLNPSGTQRVEITFRLMERRKKMK